MGCAGQLEPDFWTRGSDPPQPSFASVTPSLTTFKLAVISTQMLKDPEIFLMLAKAKRRSSRTKREQIWGKEQKKEHFLDLWK